MTRVAIADDHPIVRKGIEQLLDGETDVALVGEASNGEQLMRLLASTPCDVVLMDLDLAGRDGRSLVAQMRDRGWRMPVLMLTIHSNAQLAQRAFQLGAAGFLSADAASEELPQAIRAVAAGKRHVGARISLAAGPARDASFSNRERQVVRLYASGKSLSEIAESMQVSVRTVSTYKTRVLQKLNLTSNADLVLWAAREKMLDK